METGMWIWKIKDCAGGDPIAIAAAARQAGFKRVYIKVADSGYLFNIDPKTGRDLCPAVVNALHAVGIEAWGWQYIYGYPAQEASAAIRRITDLGLDGFVIDAEGEFKTSFQADAGNKATQYCVALRKAYPAPYPIAFSSFRFPKYHQDFVWGVFLKYCDINMPQVYWEGATNAGYQLEESLREFKSYITRPIQPIGPTYKNGGWRPTDAQISEFLAAAEKAGLTDISFFSWDECQRDLPALWETIAGYKSVPAPETPPTPPVVSPDRLALLEEKVTGLQATVKGLAEAISALSGAIKA